MAIISASRRTDIPTFYGEWLVNRLEAGEFYTRNNPYNPNAVSHITFSKEDIDCVVLWTKNPASLISCGERLQRFPCLFQYSITGYGREIENNVPDLPANINMFQEIERKFNPSHGEHRMVWRYDPIFFTSRFTPEWHIHNFNWIASNLEGYCNRVVISFVDMYDFVKRHMLEQEKLPQTINETQLKVFCSKLSKIARQHGMEIYTCAEKIDLDSVGIKHGACVDKELIEKIIGYKLKGGKDKSQRETCGCMESVDVGKYNTCLNGCLYCYARKEQLQTVDNYKLYNPYSPMLCDTVKPTDIITERRLSSLRLPEEYDQLSLF